MAINKQTHLILPPHSNLLDSFLPPTKNYNPYYLKFPGLED